MPRATKVSVESGAAYLVWCPGCASHHLYDGRWRFTGTLALPTFRESYMVHPAPGRPRCHSFVTAGRIQFLPDSEHALAGQTVDLPELEP